MLDWHDLTALAATSVLVRRACLPALDIVSTAVVDPEVDGAGDEDDAGPEDAAMVRAAQHKQLLLPGGEQVFTGRPVARPRIATLQKTFPKGQFLAVGAYKRVHAVWNAVLARKEIVAVTDLVPVVELGVLQVVRAEGRIGTLVGQLVERGSSPYLLRIFQNAVLATAPPAKHWGTEEEPTPHGQAADWAAEDVATRRMTRQAAKAARSSNRRLSVAVPIAAKSPSQRQRAARKARRFSRLPTGLVRGKSLLDMALAADREPVAREEPVAGGGGRGAQRSRPPRAVAASTAPPTGARPPRAIQRRKAANKPCKQLAIFSRMEYCGGGDAEGWLRSIEGEVAAEEAEQMRRAAAKQGRKPSDRRRHPERTGAASTPQQSSVQVNGIRMRNDGPTLTIDGQCGGWAASVFLQALLGLHSCQQALHLRHHDLKLLNVLLKCVEDEASDWCERLPARAADDGGSSDDGGGVAAALTPAERLRDVTTLVLRQVVGDQRLQVVLPINMKPQAAAAAGASPEPSRHLQPTTPGRTRVRTRTRRPSPAGRQRDRAQRDSSGSATSHGPLAAAEAAAKPWRRGWVAKLTDFGTAVTGKESMGTPVGAAQLTTLENTPPELLLAGDATLQGPHLDMFPLFLCLLHLLTGDRPYEELMEDVVCPVALREALFSVWTGAGQPAARRKPAVGAGSVRNPAQQAATWQLDALAQPAFECLAAVVAEDEGEVLADTLYRYCVLLGEAWLDAAVQACPPLADNPIVGVLRQWLWPRSAGPAPVEGRASALRRNRRPSRTATRRAPATGRRSNRAKKEPLLVREDSDSDFEPSDAGEADEDDEVVEAPARRRQQRQPRNTEPAKGAEAECAATFKRHRKAFGLWGGVDSRLQRLRRRLRAAQAISDAHHPGRAPAGGKQPARGGEAQAMGLTSLLSRLAALVPSQRPSAEECIRECSAFAKFRSKAKQSAGGLQDGGAGMQVRISGGLVPRGRSAKGKEQRIAMVVSGGLAAGQCGRTGPHK